MMLYPRLNGTPGRFFFAPAHSRTKAPTAKFGQRRTFRALRLAYCYKSLSEGDNLDRFFWSWFDWLDIFVQTQLFVNAHVEKWLFRFDTSVGKIGRSWEAICRHFVFHLSVWTVSLVMLHRSAKLAATTVRVQAAWIVRTGLGQMAHLSAHETLGKHKFLSYKNPIQVGR